MRKMFLFLKVILILPIIVNANTEIQDRLMSSTDSIAKNEIWDISKISGLKSLGSTLSLQELMIGKFAGVNILSKGGDPGSVFTMQSRGPVSISNSLHPLVYIDGIPVRQLPDEYGNFLNFINPEDIESIQVLKNANELAAYGYNAHVGVILIETKKSTSKKLLSISFNNSASVSRLLNKVDVLSASEYREAMKWKFFFREDVLEKMGDSNTDWQDEISRTAIGHNHHLNISGLINKTSYRASMGYVDQQGVIKNSDMKRINTTINLNRKFFNDNLMVNWGLSLAKTKLHFSNKLAFKNAIYSDPTKALRGSGINESRSLYDPYYVEDPLSLISQSRDKVEQQNTNWNLNLVYKIPVVQGLKAKLLIGQNIFKNKKNLYSPILIGNNDSIYHQGDFVNTLNTQRLGLSYSKKLNSFLSNVEANIFYLREKEEKSEVYYQIETGFSTRGSMDADIDAKSFGGDISFAFFEKYIFIASHRENHYKEYNTRINASSLGFEWNIHKESFMRSISNLSHLNIGVSCGLFGKSNVKEKNLFDLEPERTHTSNVFFEYGFFNNKLKGIVTAYKTKHKKLLIDTHPPETSGFNEYWRNIGYASNSGFEASVSIAPLESSNWFWNIQVNAAYNKSEVENVGQVYNEVKNEMYDNIQFNINNEEMNAFYAYPHIYKENGRPLNMIDNYEQYDKRRAYKSSLPKYVLGASSQLNYKNWEASFSVSANLGNYMFNGIDNEYGFLGRLPYNITRDAMYSGLDNKQRNYSDYYVQDASFLHLENFIIGYSFNKLFGKNINTKLYASGHNLYTFSGYRGFNSKAPGGVDFNIIPRPRRIVVGVKIDL